MADGNVNLQFRIATPDDAPQLQQLVQSAFRAHDSRLDWTGNMELASHFKIEVEEVMSNITKPDMDAAAALVATIEVSKCGTDVGRLSMIAVDPGCQRGGVGRQVLAYAEDYCHRTWGVAQFSLNALSTRKALVEWYMRRGYRKTGETSPFPRERFSNLALPDDMCFIELEKDLSYGGGEKSSLWRRRIDRRGCTAFYRIIYPVLHRSPLVESTEDDTLPSIESPVQSSAPIEPSPSCDEPLESQNSINTEPDPWSQAYQQLDEKTKKWIKSTSTDENGEKWTEDLVTIVRQREGEYKDATPKLKVGDREIIWRDYADRVVMWVTTIGDIAINFAPAPSPVVWSALKVLMKANVSQCADLVAIFGCADKVLDVIRRGKVYEIVYLCQAPSNTVMEGLEKALVALYKTSLELLAQAFIRLNEGQGKQFLRALIHAGEGAELLSTLSECERKLAMTVQACGAVELQEHKRLLQNLDEPLRRIDNRVEKLLEKIKQRDLQKALNYISSIPVGDHHIEKREARTPETCEWLLKHKEFHKWETSSRSSTLWLQGKIGAGKSFLTSKVIDRYWLDLKVAQKETVKHDEGFAYFYCTRSDPVRRDPKCIFQSYIRQLAQVPHHPTMMHKNTYDMYCKAEKELRNFSLNECKEILSELVNSYPRTVLILDALDECGLEARVTLADTLRSLVEEAKRSVKVFIASRKEADIEESLNSQNLVEIDAIDNKDDIRRYIEEEMGKSGRAWKSISDEVKVEVKTTIMSQSDGMFRWAYLQWAQLKRFKTEESIRARLGKLPSSLTEAYNEIYDKMEAHEAVILQRAVKWVICAREPPSSEVIRCVVRLASQIDDNAEDALKLSSSITESDLESICSHLIVKDSQLEVWKFPHASVAEYFEVTHKIWVDEALEDIAILLLSCLIDCYSSWTLPTLEEDVELFLKKTPDLDNHLDPRHPLQEYTRKHWVWHVKSTANPDQEPIRVPQVLKRFLGVEGPQKTSSRQYQAWRRHMLVKSARPYHMLDFDDLKPTEKSIFGICALGFHGFLKDWWDDDIDVSQVNDQGLDLLAIAAKYGHRELCSDLIDQGSNPNRILDGGRGSALAEAIGRQQFETIKLLLTRGCNNPNLNIKGRLSAICYSAYIPSLVESFLKSGADPNFRCEKMQIRMCLGSGCVFR
ncbi:hypothetical protein PT974_00434 [Cladobotryum mycophilum]|uniref:N-acetyltransferase domain-containing protein n=1 Tax=Cladobotryum mycophilum TaxID=491253 RepID=A0ABR0T0V4_9HYPO